MNRRLTLLFLLLCLTSLQGADAASRRKATLEVRSTPAGAQVTVDGGVRGVTPLTIRGLSAGRHELVITRAGYSPSRQEVTLRAGKRKLLKVRLSEVVLLDPAEKERRRTAASGVTPPLGQIGVLSRMFLSSSGFSDLGGFARVAGQAVQDPVSGMWVVTSIDFDEFGNLVITADYFLDESLTQPAGGFTIIADGLNATATYAFTAGDLAGQTGTLVATVQDLQHIALQAAGEMPGGWSYSGDFNAALTQTGFSLSGTVTLIDPNDGTTDWIVEMTLNGADFTGQVGTIQVTAHFNQDGSGEATLTDVASGEVLATVTWTVDGTATITYSDGSTETFELF